MLANCCQKVFFHPGHSYYHYGPIVNVSDAYSKTEVDLQLSTSTSEVAPSVSREKRSNRHTVVVTDRVYEYDYLRGILSRLFESAKGVRFKTDDVVLNLTLLSLQLDFGAFPPQLSHRRDACRWDGLWSRRAVRGARQAAQPALPAEHAGRLERPAPVASGGVELDQRVRQEEHERLSLEAKG